VRAIIFDLEGVFFAGDAVLPGARVVMKKIQEKKNSPSFYYQYI